MPENGSSQEAASGGIAGTEMGDQAQPENPASKRAEQPAGYLKRLTWWVAVLALDILEQME